MKSIIGLFIVGLFTLLCGCDKTNTAVWAYAPEIEFQFVDNEGNVYVSIRMVKSHSMTLLN